MKQESCVLVCVTAQKECERLIRGGKAWADKHALPLHVLHVSNDKNPMGKGETALILNHLFSLAHEVDAEMNILYDPSPAAAIARYARHHQAQFVVMGQDRSGFSLSLRAQLPAATQLIHLEE